FINKAFECLDLIGWEHAATLLPTVIGQMVMTRGAEESTAWRQPIDLVALCEEAASQLPKLFAAGRDIHGWSDHAALAQELLGDDPARIIDALKAAIRAGAVTSANRWPTEPRSGWRASAKPTSMLTGRRLITSSPTPTRSTRCSSGSEPPTLMVM